MVLIYIGQEDASICARLNYPYEMRPEQHVRRRISHRIVLLFDVYECGSRTQMDVYKRHHLNGGGSIGSECGPAAYCHDAVGWKETVGRTLQSGEGVMRKVTFL